MSCPSRRPLVATTLALACLPLAAAAQVHRAAELTADRFAALDREGTVVVLPIGVLEQHGPYLPSFTDGYVVERQAADLADALGARPDFQAVVFPMMLFGSGGANEIG